jgi:hypothetical protein
MRWISVKESLPQGRLVPVWVFVRRHGQMKAVFADDDAGKHFWLEGGKLDVTHWLPYPLIPDPVLEIPEVGI